MYYYTYTIYIKCDLLNDNNNNNNNNNSNNDEVISH